MVGNAACWSFSVGLCAMSVFDGTTFSVKGWSCFGISIGLPVGCASGDGLGFGDSVECTTSELVGFFVVLAMEVSGFAG